MASRLERSLLSRGTFNGPVTHEMIAWAKATYERVRVKLGHEARKDGWSDFIEEARRVFIPFDVIDFGDEQPHPSWGGWTNFLKTCEVRDSFAGVVFYGKTNCNYILFPNKILVRNYGYHGQALMNRIREHGWKKVFGELEEWRSKIRDLLERING